MLEMLENVTKFSLTMYPTLSIQEALGTLAKQLRECSLKVCVDVHVCVCGMCACVWMCVCVCVCVWCVCACVWMCVCVCVCVCGDMSGYGNGDVGMCVGVWRACTIQYNLLHFSIMLSLSIAHNLN